MLRQVLSKLEDPKNPLLGPNIKSLKCWGLLLPKSLKGKCVVFFFNFLMLMFTVTEYVDIWLVRSDIETVLTNVKMSMVSPVTMFKSSMFFVFQRRWKEILNYVSRADLKQRSSEDEENQKLLARNTKYCRIITYMYWFLTYFTAFLLIIKPFVIYLVSESYRHNLKNGTATYVEMVRSWVPFDKTKPFGYSVASFYQAYATIFVSGYISSYDSTAIVIMISFKTELLTLGNDSAEIFGSSDFPIDDETIKRRIAQCHRRHVELLKYSRLFNSCLSSVMFLYVFVCSVMLCATAYETTTIKSSIMNRVITMEYLSFGVAQLFMYCWHSNEVMVASQELMRGPYRSLWWCQSKRRMTYMLMLVHQYRNTVMFTAGPFTDLTVATFINILKGAYSYYTLIN